MYLEQLIKSYYNIDPMVVKSIPGRMFMKNYVILDKYQKRYFLKTCPTDTSEILLDFQLVIHELLLNDNFFVPKMLKTQKGESGFKYQNRVYCCFEYINDDNLKDYKNFISDSGEVLACIHKSLDRKNINYPVNPRKDIGTIKRDYMSWLNNAELNLNDEVDKKLLDIKPILIDFLKNFEEEKFLGLPKQIIHGDYNLNNVLTYKGRISGVIDFFNSCFSYRIIDLSEAALMYFGTNLTNEGWKFNESKQSTFINAYIKKNTLCKNELDFLPLMLQMCCISNLYNFTNDYFLYKRLPEAKRVIGLLTDIIKLNSKNDYRLIL
ncbi:phosphotransferase [Bacillus cereus]|uniref:phosphotransferase n=1 Tax=Bacillus cereus TaxID=1396 RepID=UPI00123A8F71|nr:phosphotransferase [Bacillus cereus]KAA6470407.1 hypothetical protein DX931_28640 [Bacillus cereus]